MQTLTPAEVADVLGISANRVRQLLRDRKMMAVPGSGGSKIPAEFLQDGVVLKHLAHTMALCGLGKVRAQPRETATRST